MPTPVFEKYVSALIGAFGPGDLETCLPPLRLPNFAGVGWPALQGRLEHGAHLCAPTECPVSAPPPLPLTWAGGKLEETRGETKLFLALTEGRGRQAAAPPPFPSVGPARSGYSPRPPSLYPAPPSPQRPRQPTPFHLGPGDGVSCKAKEKRRPAWTRPRGRPRRGCPAPPRPRRLRRSLHAGRPLPLRQPRRLLGSRAGEAREPRV